VRGVVVGGASGIGRATCLALRERAAVGGILEQEGAQNEVMEVPGRSLTMEVGRMSKIVFDTFVMHRSPVQIRSPAPVK